MLYILKHDLVLKMNLCRNDDSKSVYGGKKSPVSVSDEKVQANQDRDYFKHLYLFLTTKKLFIYFRYTSSLKWYRFWRCKFVKVYTVLQLNWNEFDLAIFRCCHIWKYVVKEYWKIYEIVNLFLCTMLLFILSHYIVYVLLYYPIIIRTLFN